ncbi:Acetyl-coenzyme A transporter 1 [Thelohanellus kitauei]|uniref:Acetyl-coenzyme A transporter 1 n=1 Tax=Thelohanellus kitauei TaxID=669202 RepID=A0A0C2JW60_THEKT|nr:Acetyl-coenzyme A transporter 1 [Thelohanellus kitauei]
MGFIHYARIIRDQHLKFMIVCGTVSIIVNILNSFTHASASFLFSLIINPKYAGSQLTYLNTISNLAYKWPQILVLYLVDNVTIKSCKNLENKTTSCSVTVDGFHTIAVMCLILGVVWLWKFKDQFQTYSSQAIQSIDQE